MNRSRILALLVALATGAALWVAGAGGRASTDTPDAVSAQRVARSLACVTGLPGGQAVTGALQGKVVGDLPIRRGLVDLAGREPGFTVRAGVGASASTFASQSAKTGRWYAAQPCAEPSRQQWFLGAGGSRLHHSTLVLANTRSGEAVVDVRVYGAEGELDVPGLRGLSVGDTPVRLDLAEVAPSVEDLAVSVVAVRGLVSASVVDELAPAAADRPVTEFLPGQSEPGTDLVLGGLPERPTDATLSLLNTGESAAVVEVRLIGKDGTFTSTQAKPVTALPGKLVQVPVPSAGRQGASGVRLVSPEPMAAAIRSFSRGDVVQGTPLGALGDSALIGVPAGAAGTLRLFNPGEDEPVTATVQFAAAEGRILGTERVEVAPGTAVSVAPRPLRQGDVRAIRIVDGGELRAMLDVVDGGLAALPIGSVTGETRVPAVRPRGKG